MIIDRIEPVRRARHRRKTGTLAGVFGCLLLAQAAAAQHFKRDKIAAAYVLNFARNIEWHKEDRISEFRFLILGDDESAGREMREMAASNTLKGKPIRIAATRTADVPEGTHLVFVVHGSRELAAPVSRLIAGRNILLVTDRYEDKRNVMINLIETKEQTIKFEINKANILNQGLKVLPEMVLLGGTELDVARLYRESQDALRGKEERIAALKRDLDSLNANIGISRKEIDRQSLLIARQNQDILEQLAQLERQRNQLEAQGSRLEAQGNQLEAQGKALSHQAVLAQESRQLLKRQQGEIESGKAVLSSQQEKIDIQNDSIRKQKQVLEAQGLTIEDQEATQRFLLLVIILVLGLSFVIYLSYKGKQRSNRQLQAQKLELQSMLVQLKLAKDKAQQYLDIAGVIILAVDAGRRITMINRKGCEVLGYAMEDIVGKDWFETFVPEDGRDGLVRGFQRLMAGEAGTGGYSEHRVATRGHGERLIAWHNVLLRDESGKIAGTLGSGEDITEKRNRDVQIKKLNQDLLERAAALEAANRELEAFSYSVSHDLRAPLRSIDGFSLAILEDYEGDIDERGKDYLRRVRAAAQRMAQLIDDMLKLSSVARNEMVLREIDLSGMAREIAEKSARSQPGRQVEFVIRPGMTARGDGQLLRIALENLLDNAWKYTSKHPAARIEFGSLDSDGKRVFFVKDDGAGFDMAYAQNLFGAFQRMHTAEEFPGTGVGLATVQRIVHRHGGRIWAESEIGKGATFYFSIPEKEA